ncbi:acetate kinase [Hydrogenispora ethanolica]|uniref:Acetate kinase n=1 Tax=Hydrogenispora ethanolica TaxID=1082276 RepID=A0A4R1RTQ3_HYDET|nr:acetate kinase [Hydrogenispora ethanolica]TCL69923.1 acetate kinase [Hydrogenispora ethanolica]
MLILVLNSGSSSLKYKLYQMQTEEVLAAGLVERIGSTNGNAVINHQRPDGEKIRIEQRVSDHSEALKAVLDFLTAADQGVVRSLDEIKAVGHRVLHGGEIFSSAVVVGDKELAEIESLRELGPLHMPANIMGIKACRELMPNTPQVAVFDTAFHQTMPRSSFLYALPYEYYEKYKVRRYGFHGTSHRYVSNRAAQILGKNLSKLKMITLHMGNGSSAAAIKDGKCFDTSMGFTPLEGFVMGTRCGDMDPAIVPFLQNALKLNPNELDTLMNKKSGFLGMTGFSDMRDIQKAREEGNERAQDAYNIFIQRVVKYVGSYFAELGGLDVLVFTAGIGENDCQVRADICERLAHLGVDFDFKKNEGLRGKEAILSKARSKVTVMLVPTNEELLIAQDSYELVNL